MGRVSVPENIMNYSEEICVRPSPSLNSASAVRVHPLNMFERLAIAENYDFERTGTDELHVSLGGLWCDHDVSLVWKPELEQLNLYLLFEGRTPGGRSDDICRLLSLLNERLVSGHFDFWDKDSALVYRNTLNLSGGAVVRVEQAMALLASALDAAERGYPACQYVVWAGKSPEDALNSALLDLAGQG